MGTALLVVVLQHAPARGEAPAADAYAHTFWWALAIGACALIPAALYPWQPEHTPNPDPEIARSFCQTTSLEE